jgi:hypothetical protein
MLAAQDPRAVLETERLIRGRNLCVVLHRKSKGKCFVMEALIVVADRYVVSTIRFPLRRRGLTLWAQRRGRASYEMALIKNAVFSLYCGVNFASSVYYERGNDLKLSLFSGKCGMCFGWREEIAESSTRHGPRILNMMSIILWDQSRAGSRLPQWEAMPKRCK